MPIVEAVIVVAITAATVVALYLLAWTIVVRSRHELYIAPFHIAGGQSDPALGVALANMLGARLQRLQRELASVHQVLQEQAQPPSAADDPGAIVLPVWIDVPRGVFEPVNIDVSIGSVSVGGLLAWLQARAFENRTLRLTVSFEEGRAIVSGSLEPLRVTRISYLWIETGCTADDIVTKTAYAIAQSRNAERGHGPIEAFDLEEFEILLWCLYRVAEINRRALSGGSHAITVANSVEVLERLMPLTERFPEWQELLRLALNIAERARRPEETRRLRTLLSLSPKIGAGDGSRAAESTELLEREKTFVSSVDSYFKRVFPGKMPPRIIFKSFEEGPGVRAMWNGDLNRYEVNSEAVGLPGLDAYIAIMGRFMDLHYSCVQEIDRNSTAVIDVWNLFRNAVVGYLIETDPQNSSVDIQEIVYGNPLLEALRELDAQHNELRDKLRCLVLALVESFDCDWDLESLPDQIVDVNKSLGCPVSSELLVAALRDHM